MLLVGEFGAARIPISAAPQILGQGPIIPQFEPGYMLVPPGPPGQLGFFCSSSGAFPGSWVRSGTSSGAGPSTGPFAGNYDDDDDDDDTD